MADTLEVERSRDQFESLLLSLVFALVCSAAPLRALEPALPVSHFVIDRWGFSRGFPEETIVAIAQSPDGLLWVAHADGLVRFNGQTAVPSTWPAAKAMDRSLRALTVDAAGNLWGMTVTGTLVRVPAGAPHPPEGTAVEVVGAADPKLRVPTWRAGIVALGQALRLSGPLGIVDHPGPARLLLPIESIATPVAFDRAGAVWSASENGRLARWQAGQGETLVATLPAVQYSRLLAAAPDRIWLRRRDQLLCWCHGNLQSWPLPAGFSNSSAYEPLLEDSHGSVWLGGRGKLLRFRQGQFDGTSLAPDLDETPVTALFEDREGALWAGTLTGDLIRLRDSPVSSFGRAEGLAGDVINSILQEPGGAIWTHSMNRGLTAWRGGQRFANLLEFGNLWYIARDPATAQLIIGSGPRNYRMEGNRPVLIPDPAVKELGRISAWWLHPATRKFFVARDSGLYLQSSLLPPTATTRVSTFAGGQIFAHDGNGTVWCANQQELLQWSPQAQRILLPENRMPDELIHALLWDPTSRRLWVGTNRGLLSWNPDTQSWDPRGLTDDRFFELQLGADQGLWAGTREGIVRINPARWLAGVREPSLRLTHADGLRSLNFGMSRGQGSTLLPDGTLLFASMQGVVAVNPLRIPSPRLGPTPLIAELQADDTILPLTNPIRVAPGSSRVKVSFDAFSVSTPRQIAVQYLLEGVDDQWQPAGPRRSIQYNNLGPGPYRFRLRSSWLDGTAPTETSLAWDIPPVFYQTLWFRLLAGTLLLTLVTLAIRHRTLAVAARTAELEARVADRTRELEAAKSAAEAAVRVKAEFLATMSHELRTPMNGVLGLAELLASTHLDENQQELLSTLRSSGESLLGVVNDVLDLSKIESGKLQIERLPTSIPQLIERAADIVRPLALKKGLTLELVSTGQPLEWMESDPARFRQILLNLLSNAIKFTASGSITVTTHWTPGKLELSVQDSGIGIHPDKLPLLFQNFVQGDSSTTRLYGGTGLGLAISRRLVEAMGGSIACASTLGQGSSFSLTLPAVPLAAPTVHLSLDHAIAPAGLRVLVAEDNLTNQRVIVGLLRKIGVEAIVVANGLEAVNACLAQHFDLVLMDCQMPLLDGYSATRQIRQQLGAAAPPVVALTAHAMESDRAECLAAGMCAYLTKPVVLDQLRQVIHELDPALR